MTPVRRAAKTIAGFVVRCASPGCKEWAEGLAREAEFVPGDWSALRWAIGSTRVLLDRRETTVSSLSEAAAKARQFSALGKGGIANRPVFAATRTGLEIYFGVSFLAAHNVQQRIWCGLFVLISICLDIFIERTERRGRRMVVPSRDDDAVGWTVYYRSQLEQICNLRFLMEYLIPLSLLNASVLLGERVGIRENPVIWIVIELIFVCQILFFLWKRRQYQYQIAALDALLGEAC